MKRSSKCNWRDLGGTFIIRVLLCFLATGILCLACLSVRTGFAVNDHEYAEIKKVEFGLQDKNLKSLKDDEKIDLSELIGDKKVVLIWYFAPWCENSKYDTPLLIKLYEKYASQGFDIVAISNYAPVEEVSKYVKDHNLKFRVFYETTEKKDDSRLAASHFKYRNVLGDSRKWGTPLYPLTYGGDSWYELPNSCVNFFR